MTINLEPNERIDDLHRNGYKIIQNPEGFCFGMDAVLLSGFAMVKEKEKVLDMGTGTGIIPILLEAKTPGEHFTGLEIQERSADMARRSVKLNNLEEKIDIVCGDICESSKLFGKAVFDVVTTNPPYMNENHGLTNPDMPKAIARHEIYCTLEDIVREASYVLKPGGRFYMVHRPRSHEDVYVTYSVEQYKDVSRTRWNPYKEEPIKNASELCSVWRKIVNTDVSRQIALLEIIEKHPKAIIFYNFDYELEILKGLYYGDDVKIAEWNGHTHQPIPDGDKWIYLVQYNAGAEGWNCITTDTIIFYSQNYSYRIMEQSAGRIDRMNTPFKELYYYHLKSRSGIDLAIGRALREKKNFNETKYVGSRVTLSEQRSLAA